MRPSLPPIANRWGVIVAILSLIVALPTTVVALREFSSQDKDSTPVLGTITTLGQLSEVGLTGGLAVDREGNLYVAARTAILRVDGEGNIDVIAGEPPNGMLPGTAKGPPLEGVRDLAVTESGDVYFSEDSQRVRRVDSSGSLQVVAGSGQEGDLGADGVPAGAAALDDPRGVAFDREGNLLIADMLHDRVRRVGTDERVTTVGGYIDSPNDMASGPDGRVYVEDYRGRVYEVTRHELILRFEPPRLDRRSEPPAQGLRSSFLAVAPDNSLLVSDEFANRIWRVRGDDFEALAGTGAAVTGGDGGPASEAQLESPWAVAISNDWRVYVSTTMGIRTFALQ